MRNDLQPPVDLVLFDGVQIVQRTESLLLCDAAQGSRLSISLQDGAAETVCLIRLARADASPTTIRVGETHAARLLSTAQARVAGSTSRRYWMPSHRPLTLLAFTWISLVRHHAVALGVSTAALALAFELSPAGLATTITAAATPLTLVSFLALHEAAHWAVVRCVLRSPAAGALLLDGQRACIVRPALDGRRLAAVAAAGPLAAGSAAVAALVAVLALPAVLAVPAATPHPEAVILLAAVALANLLGLTPWTTDGVQLARGLS